MSDRPCLYCNSGRERCSESSMCLECYKEFECQSEEKEAMSSYDEIKARDVRDSERRLSGDFGNQIDCEERHADRHELLKMVEGLDFHHTELSKQSEKWLKRAETAEAKLAAVGELQRYAVNQEIGREGEYPMFADNTGSWYAVGELEAILKGDK